jgi:hypothetical protein
MRILILTAHRNVVGGVEKYLQALIPALLARSHDIALVHEHTCNLRSERIDPAARSLPTWSLSEADTKTILQSIAQWEPDVVY